MAGAFAYEIPEAQRNQLAADIGEERVELYEHVVKDFPYDLVLGKLSALSGIPKDELYARTDLQVVVPYSNSTLDEIGVTQADTLSQMSWEPHETLDVMRGIGGITLTDKVIGVNLSGISEHVDLLAGGSQDAQRLFETTVYVTVVHEFVHAVDNIPMPGGLMHGKRNKLKLWEGVVDALAMQAMTIDDESHARHREMIDKYPLITGYGEGPKPAARFFLYSLGPTETSAAFLRGDIRSMTQKFDEKYGEGAWEKFENYALPDTGSDFFNRKLENVLPLYAMLDIAAAKDMDAYEQTVQKINARHERVPILPIVRDGKFLGVTLRDLDQHSELLNALVVDRIAPGKTLILGSSDSFLGDRSVRTLDTHGDQRFSPSETYYYSPTLPTRNVGPEVSNEQIQQTYLNKIQAAEDALL